MRAVEREAGGQRVAVRREERVEKVEPVQAGLGLPVPCACKYGLRIGLHAPCVVRASCTPPTMHTSVHAPCRMPCTGHASGWCRLPVQAGLV